MNKGSAYLIVGIVTAVFMLAGYGHACEYNRCYTISVGALVADEIPAVGDIHAFSIPVTAGEVLLIRTNRTWGTIDPQISLLYPSGVVIEEAGAVGTGRAELLSPRLTLTDSYTILIRDAGGERTGGFNLAVQSVKDPVNAPLIYYDGYRPDSLMSLAQMNAYRFQASAGDIVSVEMIDAARSLTPSIRLFGPDGKLLGSDVASEFALISNVLLSTAGEYVIIAADNLGDEVGRYFLVLLRSATDASDNGNSMPADFLVEQNRPNPFNPRTTIEFSLPHSARVTIDIYNLLGETIRTLVSQTMPAGDHSVVWDGRADSGGEVSSGIYFYRLRADDFSTTKKMLLLR
jgi:hypothetical protein